MLSIVNEMQFKDGDYIFKEGSYGDWIYVILSGQVEISKYCRGQKVIVETLKEGDVFGEMSFVDKTPRSASAIAKGNVSLGIVDRDLLDHEYNKLSQDMRMVFRALVKRLRETTAKISAFSGRQDQRAAKPLDIQFKSGRDFTKAYAVNIGGGGLLVRIDEPVSVGTRCAVCFNLPGESLPIETDCQVVWSSLGTEEDKKIVMAGLQFIDLKAEDRDRISSYVNKVSQIEQKQDD